jgi:2'-5' RNA ligase
VRLFAAVWPPPEVTDRLRALALPASGTFRPVRDGTWHVTLAFFGEVDDHSPLTEALSAASASMPAPVSVTLGPRTRRLGRQVLSLDATGLDEVAAAVGREAAARTGYVGGRFTGHLTLGRARGRSPVPTQAIGLRFEATFEVRSVSLVRSTLGPDGPTYEELGLFGLVAGAYDDP